MSENIGVSKSGGMDIGASQNTLPVYEDIVQSGGGLSGGGSGDITTEIWDVTQFFQLFD